MKKFILLLTFTLFSLAAAWSFSAQVSEPVNINGTDGEIEQSALLLESEMTSEDRKETSLVIKTNIESAKVYLNGNYQGLTPLTITSLPQGSYSLKLEKENYQTLQADVMVKKGEIICYQADMKKTTGFISIQTSPENASVLVDGSVTKERTLQLEEGSHKIEVNCFGCKTWSSVVEVKCNTTRSISVVLDETPFAITSFSADKEKFNPRSSGDLSKIRLNFSVTAEGQGTLMIVSSEGEVVWKKFYASFGTWNHSEEWNGRNYYGLILHDGIYTATFSSGGFNRSTDIKIDSSLKVPMTGRTNSGSGLGSVPSAEMYPAKSFMAGFRFGVASNLTAMSFSGLPIDVSVLACPFNWLEFSAAYSSLLATTNNLNGNLSVKAGGKINMAKTMAFNYAAIARFGMSNYPVYEPYGCDSGNGLGGGAALGFSTVNLYAGISSIFLWRPVTGVLSSGSDMALENGVMIQYRNQYFTAGAFANVSSTFGNFTYTCEGSSWDTSIASTIRMIDAGIDGSYQIPGSTVFANLKTGVYIYSKEPLYYYVMAGISILF